MFLIFANTDRAKRIFVFSKLPKSLSEMLRNVPTFIIYLWDDHCLHLRPEIADRASSIDGGIISKSSVIFCVCNPAFNGRNAL